jgi:hypothetical protein
MALAPLPRLYGRRLPTWVMSITFPPALLAAFTYVGVVQRFSRACVYRSRALLPSFTGGSSSAISPSF